MSLLILVCMFFSKCDSAVWPVPSSPTHNRRTALCLTVAGRTPGAPQCLKQNTHIYVTFLFLVPAGIMFHVSVLQCLGSAFILDFCPCGSTWTSTGMGLVQLRWVKGKSLKYRMNIYVMSAVSVAPSLHFPNKGSDHCCRYGALMILDCVSE